MTQVLPVLEVLRCYFDADFEPQLPAMRLRWREPESGPTERVWRLPEGVSLHGPAPSRFGISIQRLDADAYAVRLLWDRTCLIWLALERRQLEECDVVAVLQALGTDLGYVLDQPIDQRPMTFPQVA